MAPKTPTASARAVMQMDFMVDVFLNVNWSLHGSMYQTRAAQGASQRFKNQNNEERINVHDVLYLLACFLIGSFLYIYIQSTGELFGSSRLRGHRLNAIMPS